MPNVPLFDMLVGCSLSKGASLRNKPTSLTNLEYSYKGVLVEKTKLPADVDEV